MEDPEAAAVVAFVQAVADREPFNGTYVGVSEWPDGGRLAEQPASVVEAIFTVLGELQLLAGKDAKDTKTPADGPPRP
jgi:hypothetical protein